ncbi:hypothetical protein RvY_02641-2 [Ramazzottius varieornatus]|uniref:Uncharacterized protein n=1 Tax=Ramazzottius varieornatus TaxID=947166 RepID=A0A1D1USH4_RAMVA|nr:hypothetical protein RvY_02641-2 [Ramazzottius varieornatus]
MVLLLPTHLKHPPSKPAKLSAHPNHCGSQHYTPHCAFHYHLVHVKFHNDHKLDFHHSVLCSPFNERAHYHHTSYYYHNNHGFDLPYGILYERAHYHHNSHGFDFPCGILYKCAHYHHASYHNHHCFDFHHSVLCSPFNERAHYHHYNNHGFDFPYGILYKCAHYHLDYPTYIHHSVNLDNSSILYNAFDESSHNDNKLKYHQHHVDHHKAIHDDDSDCSYHHPIRLHHGSEGTANHFQLCNQPQRPTLHHPCTTHHNYHPHHHHDPVRRANHPFQLHYHPQRPTLCNHNDGTNIDDHKICHDVGRRLLLLPQRSSLRHYRPY